MKSRLAWLAAVALLATCAAPASANLITNGDFETSPVPAANGIRKIAAGGTGSNGLTGWTVSGVDVLLINAGYTETGGGRTLHFLANNGTNALDITGKGNTGPTDAISQATAITTEGQVYQLSFALGYLNGGLGTVYQGDAITFLSINGGTETKHINNTGSALDNSTDRYVSYSLFTMRFVAGPGSNTTLQFRNGSPSNTSYAGLDDVSVVAVPEPASLAMGGMSLLTLGAFSLVRRLRRRNV